MPALANTRPTSRSDAYPKPPVQFLAGTAPPRPHPGEQTPLAPTNRRAPERNISGAHVGSTARNSRRPSDSNHGHGATNLIGASPAITAIRTEIETLADSSASVLITGPSGAGKDVVAQLLHQRGRRSAAAFVALNCAAVARELLESEMFGHEAGAFTGAVKARAGRFEAADSGTLFLDEIGDMALAMQAKLLRALETRIVERVGGMLPITVDVRIIAATSVDLIAAIDRGCFRSDLLYRLDVIRIDLPALAERLEDVPLLIDHFIARMASRVRFTSTATDALCAYDWPGNVRELRNVIERAEALLPGQRIEASQLPRLLRPGNRPAAGGPVAPAAGVGFAPAAGVGFAPAAGVAVNNGVDLKRILTDLECAYITEALRVSGGAIAATAKLLGLQRTTLIEKMRRLGIVSA